MDTRDLLIAPPAPDRTMRVLERVGALLEVNRCYLWRRAFHFPLAFGWTVAITPETANRYRVEACRRGRFGLPSWARADDGERLEQLVFAIADGVRSEV